MCNPYSKAVTEAGLTVSPDRYNLPNYWIREANEVVNGVIEPKKQHRGSNAELSQLPLVR